MRTLTTCIILVSFLNLHAQFIENPSFEGGVAKQNAVAPSWSKCLGTPDLLDTALHSASEGFFFTLLATVPSIEYTESIGQVLLDTIKENLEYRFSIDAVNWKSSPFGTSNADSVILNIYLDSVLCGKSLLVLTTGIIPPDLPWHTYSTSFITDSDYTHIYIEVRAKTSSAIIIDNLKLDIITGFENQSAGLNKPVVVVSSNVLKANSLGTLYLHDVNGRIVEKKQLNTEEMPLYHLPAGFYVWRFVGPGGVETGKFVK